jgi:hypothetical protein
MGIVEAYFDVMRARGKTFKDMKDLLRQFLDFLDLSHPGLTTQNNRYDFVHNLKLHIQNPVTYRLQNWRKYGIYDCETLETDMDVSSGDSTDSDDVLQM